MKPNSIEMLRWMRQTVHQAYHAEGEPDDCKLAVCAAVTRHLKEVEELPTLPEELHRMQPILKDITSERLRQERLRAAGKFTHTAATLGQTHDRRNSVLVEEVGEVARALNDNETPGELRTELIQVAAVAVAWVEAIDVEEEARRG